MAKILAIDDIDVNIQLLTAILEEERYDVRSCTVPEEALDIFREFQPDLVLLDLHMPGMTGFDLLSAFRAESPDRDALPILVFTADLTDDARLKALELGASDFLIKPGIPSEILLRVRNFLRAHTLYRTLSTFNEELERKVRERTQALWESQIEVIQRLASACEFRDDQTAEHAERVGELAGRIAMELGVGKPLAELIRLAAPLHDIGKIAVPDNILLKRGSLTVEEYQVMQRHADVGARILAGGRSHLLIVAERIARTHHERWDGAGYPRQLRGEAIPIEGRIVAVADVFDSLTSNRPYRKPMSRSEAIGYIAANSGKHFDPEVVQAFLRVIAALPNAMAA